MGKVPASVLASLWKQSTVQEHDAHRCHVFFAGNIRDETHNLHHKEHGGGSFRRFNTAPDGADSLVPRINATINYTTLNDAVPCSNQFAALTSRYTQAMTSSRVNRDVSKKEGRRTEHLGAVKVLAVAVTVSSECQRRKMV